MSIEDDYVAVLRDGFERYLAAVVRPLLSQNRDLKAALQAERKRSAEREDALAIMWNPYNKVVQDHRDGTIDHARTNEVRARIGLPTPWTPCMAETEVHLPPIFV